MNEALKPRFAVDLDEIERQLSQAHPSVVQPAPASRNDPLAELARIVGQDDPFQSLLGDKPRQRPSDPAGLDDLFDVAPAPREHEVRTRQGYALRGSVEAPAAAHGYAEPQVSHQGHQSAASQGSETYAPDYDQDYYHNDRAQPDALVYAPQDERGHRVAKVGARKGLVAVGAVAAAILVGLGGAYLYAGGRTALMSGEPPLITAKNEPTKIQPQTPGGLEIPNQNKQIYERAANETLTKVVNREEQPIDVRQATRMPVNADSTGATDAPAKVQQTGGLNLGEPRRVRTVSIRPDGGVVGAEGAAGRPAATPGGAMTTPQVAPAAPSGPAAAPGGLPRQSAVPPMPTPPTATSPARPVATTPVAAAPKPTPATTAGGGALPQPSATPVSQPAPQRVASAQPIAIAPAPAAAPVAVEASATGGFSVQLGVSPSEAEARTTFQKMQQKYADLSGKGSMIRKADVNGSTVYRVRVGPMSRDDAASLCSKLQGQGGQCFVAKN